MEGERRKLYEETHKPVKLVLVSTTTLEERDKYKAFVEQLVDDMTCKTSPKISGVELTMCTPINTVELFNKARALLAKQEAK